MSKFAYAERCKNQAIRILREAGVPETDWYGNVPPLQHVEMILPDDPLIIARAVLITVGQITMQRISLLEATEKGIANDIVVAAHNIGALSFRLHALHTGLNTPKVQARRNKQVSRGERTPGLPIQVIKYLLENGCETKTDVERVLDESGWITEQIEVDAHCNGFTFFHKDGRKSKLNRSSLSSTVSRARKKLKHS